MKALGSEGVVVVVLIAIGLSACGHKVRTQEWYSENLDAADKRARWCLEQQGKNKLSMNPEDPVRQDCTNAGMALAYAQAMKFMGGGGH